MPTASDDDHPARVSLAAAWDSVDVRAAADFWCKFGDALLAAVARHAQPVWTPQLTVVAERALGRAMRAIRRAAAHAGDGRAWWHVEVIGHDRPSPDIAILTVRPWRRLPFRPGQAVPVCTPRRPGHWRWLSPANAPRADGTVELHVRAVAGGTGLAPLRALVEQVAAAPDGRRVTLIVGARAFTDLYDSIALDKLQCAHDWLTIVPAFSDDPCAGPAERGDALTIALDHHEPEQDIYLCGPPAMLADARSRLRALDIRAARIHLPRRVGE
ncbi:FAD-binding oxidoreductase [Micromonospora sp. NPDC048835]|uniref:FAD-binding oxidoreductase n=1 Tax=Micromonospora sp. NPDC048835 TaxID=3155147 RepID=UPI0033C82942